MFKYYYWLYLVAGICFMSCDDQPSSHRVQTDTLEATKMGKFYPKPSIIAKPTTQQETTSPETERDVFQPKPTYRKKASRNIPYITWRPLTTIQKTKVWISNMGSAIFFKSGMSIDADGSPKAYHPKNIGLDDLKHAGKMGIGGHWLLKMESQ